MSLFFSLSLIIALFEEQSNVSELSVIIVVVFMLFGFVGSWIGAKIVTNKIGLNDFQGNDVYVINDKKYKFILGVTLIGSILFLKAVIDAVGLNLLMKNPEDVRLLHFTGGVSVGKFSSTYTIGFLYAVSIISGIRAITGKVDVYTFLPLLAAIIIDFAYVGRIYVIYSIVLFIVPFVLLKKYDNLLNAFKGVKGFVVIGMFFSIIVFSSLARNDDANIFNGLYNYFYSPMLVLSYHLDSIKEFSYGTHMLYPIYLVLNKLGVVDLNDIVFIMENYVMTKYGVNANAFPVIGLLYVDFGFVAVIVAPVLYFSLYQYVDKMRTISGDIYYLYIQSFMMGLAVFMLHGISLNIPVIICVVLLFFVSRKFVIKI